ncbi:MAG: M1 family aminopeptidase [Gammaproteobacteria bacterium]|nr:M1 family aminopeptidase [Gammaproteobacteria bacterium]
MRRILNILFTVFSCLGVASASVPVEPYSEYDISVKLNIWEHSLKGEQKVRYVNKTDKTLDHIYFVLIANHSSEKNPYVHDIVNDEGYWSGWEGNATVIEDIENGKGEKLAFSLEQAPTIFQKYSLNDVLLRIQLPLVITPGEIQELKIKFTTVFSQHKYGDQNYWQEIYNWRFGWNPIELASKDGKWDFDSFRLVPAMYKLRLEVPKGFEVVAGADTGEEIAETKTSRTFSFESRVPQSSIPLSMGPGLKRVSFQGQRPQIDSWYRRAHAEPARQMAYYADEIIRYFEPLFGTYRYQKLAIVENSVELTGLASDGLIYIPENFYRYKDLIVPGALDKMLEYLLAHEIAHMWWGIGVSADFAAENWLSEAFANYMAYTYMEHKYGREDNVLSYENPDLLMWLVKYFAGDISIHHLSEYQYLDSVYLGWDEAIIKKPSDVEYGNTLGTRTYEKGYWVLRALENEFGRDNLLQIFKKAYSDYQGKQMTVAEFQLICEETIEEPMDWFFSQWLYGDSQLDFRIADVESEATNEGFMTQIHVEKSGMARASTSILVETRNGEIINRPISADKGDVKIALDTRSPVINVTVDPYQKLPDLYRPDNTWPRKYNVRFGYLDFNVDKYSIRYYALPAPLEIPASGEMSAGLMIGVSGGYAPVHQWSLESVSGSDRGRYYFNNKASMRYRFSAWNSLTGDIHSTGNNPSELKTDTYSVQVKHQFTLFQSPNIGVSPRVLLDSNIIENALVMVDHEGWYENPRFDTFASEYNGPIALWRFSFLRNDALKLALKNRVIWDYAPPSINDKTYYKIEYFLDKKFRLYPNWHLTLNAKAAYASENTPTPELFALEEFKSDFGDQFRRTMAGLNAEVEFPISRELEVKMLNAVVMKSIYGNMFTHVGTLGSELIDDSAVQVGESGAQLKFVFTTLGGVMDFSLNAGAVYPWKMQNTQKKATFTPFIRTEFATVF